MIEAYIREGKDYTPEMRELLSAKKEALAILKKAGIVITKEEEKRFWPVDFGLGRIREIGLQMLVYINTPRYCAKELVLLPHQTCPEHMHPRISKSNPGKQETFRCRWGIVYLYIPGPPTPKIHAKLPRGKENTFTVKHEIVLRPGEQYTLPPQTLHWFQAGPKGAVVSEFSSMSVDSRDIFTDPQIQEWRRRAPVIDEISCR